MISGERQTERDRQDDGPIKGGCSPHAYLFIKIFWCKICATIKNTFPAHSHQKVECVGHVSVVIWLEVWLTICLPTIPMIWIVFTPLLPPHATIAIAGVGSEPFLCASRPTGILTDLLNTVPDTQRDKYGGGRINETCRRKRGASGSAYATEQSSPRQTMITGSSKHRLTNKQCGYIRQHTVQWGAEPLGL